MSGSEFVEFDWSEGLDLEQRLQRRSDDRSVKGMFYTQIVDAAADRGVDLGTPKFSAFRDYSMHDWLRLMARAADEVFPEMAPAAAVRELARPTYPRFRESLLGRVIFTVTEFDSALRLASKAYRRVGPARCTVTEHEPGRAVLQLREVWEFPAWQAGIYIGGFEAFGLTGHVRHRPVSLCDLDLELSWTVP